MNMTLLWGSLIFLGFWIVLVCLVSPISAKIGYDFVPTDYIDDYFETGSFIIDYVLPVVLKGIACVIWAIAVFWPIAVPIVVYLIIYVPYANSFTYGDELIETFATFVIPIFTTVVGPMICLSLGISYERIFTSVRTYRKLIKIAKEECPGFKHDSELKTKVYRLINEYRFCFYNSADYAVECVRERMQDWKPKRREDAS